MNPFSRILSICALASALSAQADVTLPSVFTDHMVLQRGFAIRVWGKAAPAEKVTVTFRDQSASATADELGMWKLELPAFEAGGPFELVVQGNNTITLKDVMVGDVWLASGQSNMGLTLQEVTNAQAEVAAANHPRIRLFQVKQKVSQFQTLDVEANPWTRCEPFSAAGFSAAAYFFGKELETNLDVPIGLINSSWGGTPVEAWMDLRALTSDARFMPSLAEWAARIDQYPVKKLRRDKEISEWQAACERAKAEGKTPPNYPWVENEGNSWMPAGTYNAMIYPLAQFPIRGAIWYQGESNATDSRYPRYEALFETMITDWRRAWNIGDFPFLFVQLPNWRNGGRWPDMREAQLQALKLPRTGMAIAIDIGDAVDIHPKNKQDIGKRLALAARAVAYGQNIEYSGPIFKSASTENAGMRLKFDHSGGGLVAKGETLKGFEIAGADGKFVPAQARIDGNGVIVSNATITAPAHVRYDWSADPDGNLYNSEGLPASPFRTGN